MKRVQVWKQIVMFLGLAFALAYLVGAGASVDAQAQAKRGGQQEFGDYEPAEPWQQWFDDADHAKFTWGSVAAVFAETPDRIWIAQRGELPLPEGEKPGTTYGDMKPAKMAQSAQTPRMRWHHVIRVVDRNGKTVQWWGNLDAQFDKPGGRGPHAIKISPYDPAKKVWVVDDNMHMVYRYTYDGKLDHTWGEIGVPGRDANHFNRPTDIDFLPDGSYFITDGYVGNRVAKYDKNDKFLLDWGSKAADDLKAGPSEMSSVHSIAIDKDKKVYIADREHGRIQVFDENGKFLDMWDVATKPQRRNGTMYVYIPAGEDAIWASDLQTGRFIKYDLKGNFQYSWGSIGTWTGATLCQHAMTVDQNKNLYVADCTLGRVNKYIPKPGANPAHLIGPRVMNPNWK